MVITAPIKSAHPITDSFKIQDGWDIPRAIWPKSERLFVKKFREVFDLEERQGLESMAFDGSRETLAGRYQMFRKQLLSHGRVRSAGVGG